MERITNASGHGKLPCKNCLRPEEKASEWISSWAPGHQKESRNLVSLFEIKDQITVVEAMIEINF